MNNVFNLPDIKFINYLRIKHGLNRGVYNEIDSWFYEYGIKDIKKRRQLIVCFLESKSHLKKNGRMKFGHKNLTPHLLAYFNEARVTG